LHFCADDWAVVRDLALDVGMSPLGRCNAAYADFDLREDFEALLNETRDEPDHADLEARMLDAGEAALADPGATDRELVEARLVGWTLEDAETGDADRDSAAERGTGD
jgi:hypothetical protein